MSLNDGMVHSLSFVQSVKVPGGSFMVKSMSCTGNTDRMITTG